MGFVKKIREGSDFVGMARSEMILYSGAEATFELDFNKNRSPSVCPTWPLLALMKPVVIEYALLK